MNIIGKIINAEKVSFKAMDGESFPKGAFTNDIVIIQTQETFHEASILNPLLSVEKHRYRFYVSTNWGMNEHGRYVLLKEINPLPHEDVKAIFKLYKKDVEEHELKFKIFN